MTLVRLIALVGAALVAACAAHRSDPSPSEASTVGSSSVPTASTGLPSSQPSATAVTAGSSSAAAGSASAIAVTSASATPTAAAKVDPCDELRGRLASSDPAVKRKAAIEAGNADCSETFYDQAVGTMIEVAKSLSGDDDSMMLAADTLCIHTRHPATRKRTYDVYTQYLDRRFAGGLQARARDRYRSHDCYLALKPGTDTRLNR